MGKQRGDREVVILGVGLHPFVKAGTSGKTFAELGREPIARALEDSGVPFKDIEAAYLGHVMVGPQQGISMLSEFGMTGIPFLTVETACSSSTQAVFRAADDISFGRFDVVLAMGVEKMGGGFAPLPNPDLWPAVMGLTPIPVRMGMSMRKYMSKYGATYDQLCQVRVQEGNNAALAPHAMYRNRMTLEEVKAGRMIAHPINVLMCTSNADGASAAVLCTKEKARQYTSKNPITVAAWTRRSPQYTPAGEEESHIREQAKDAFEMAGIGPEDVGVVQVHNPFTPGEFQTPEAMGLLPEGEGCRMIGEGKTSITGKLPINTDGGTVACGHPLGATGLRQISELVWQLRGEAGERQVAGPPKVAFQQNAGAGGMTIGIYTR